MGDFLDILKALSESGFDIASIIIGVAIAILIFYWKAILGKIMGRMDDVNDVKTKYAERYSIESAQKINDILQDMVRKDPRLSNVILCNYHNGIASDANFSYYHFTALSEQLGNTTNQCFDVWREKSYINYQPELKYIHSNRSAIIDLNSQEDVETFPKLSKLVEDSKAKVGLFIPINGVGVNIGMVILLFHSDVVIDDRAEYIYSISEEIEQLAILIDYRRHINDIKKKRKKLRATD